MAVPVEVGAGIREFLAKDRKSVTTHDPARARFLTRVRRKFANPTSRLNGSGRLRLAGALRVSTAGEDGDQSSRMTRPSSLTTTGHPWTLHVDRSRAEPAGVELAGLWRKEDRLPDPADIWRDVRAGPPVHRLTFDASRVTEWDSGLVTFATKLLEEAKALGIEVDRSG